MPSQSSALRAWIKSSEWFGTVFMSLNLSISGREEVGFCDNSDVANTHNPIYIGEFNTCL